MPKGKGYGGRMPNEPKGNARKQSYHGYGTSGGGSNKGPNSGVKMSDEMRADVKKAPSSKNPYPRGLA